MGAKLNSTRRLKHLLQKGACAVVGTGLIGVIGAYAQQQTPVPQPPVKTQVPQDLTPEQLAAQKREELLSKAQDALKTSPQSSSSQVPNTQTSNVEAPANQGSPRLRGSQNPQAVPKTQDQNPNLSPIQNQIAEENRRTALPTTPVDAQTNPLPTDLITGERDANGVPIEGRTGNEFGVEGFGVDGFGADEFDDEFGDDEFDRDEFGNIIVDPFAVDNGGSSAEQNLVGESVVIRALDKVTAKTSDFTVKTGESLTFGALRVDVKYCEKTPPTEAPETFGFLQVFEKQLDGKGREAEPLKVFSGWMFSSSPALSPLEHNVYDIWVLDCVGGAADPLLDVFDDELDALDTADPLQDGVATPDKSDLPG